MSVEEDPMSDRLTPNDVADAAVDWYEQGIDDERKRIAEAVRELRRAHEPSDVDRLSAQQGMEDAIARTVLAEVLAIIEGEDR